MNHKIKALGLALVVVFAMSAIVASAASAASFHAGEAHTILNGEQVGSHELTVGSGFGAITCSTVKFTGTTTATTESSQVINSEYKGCKDSFGRTVDFTKFFIYEITPVPPTTATDAHLIAIVVVIHITSGSGTNICTVKIPPQTINNIVIHNIANGDTETTISTNNLTTETSGGFFNCGVSNGHHTGGSYTGTDIFRGTSTGGANVNISVS